jgi:hypothetical protein
MPMTKSAGIALSRRQLTDLAVTYAMLLGVEFEKAKMLDGEWMAFGKADEDEPTLIHGYWHVGPHPSREVVAKEALGALGFRIRPNGELYEF